MKHGKLFYSHHVAVRDGLDLVDVELVHPLVHDAVERVEELDDLEGGAALGDHGEVDDRVEVDGGGLEAVGDVLSSGGGGQNVIGPNVEDEMAVPPQSSSSSPRPWAASCR